MSEVAKILDVFFNGRRADAPPPTSKRGVTLTELIKRRSSVVLHDGKLYRVTVERVEKI